MFKVHPSAQIVSVWFALPPNRRPDEESAGDNHLVGVPLMLRDPPEELKTEEQSVLLPVTSDLVT